MTLTAPCPPPPRPPAEPRGDHLPDTISRDDARLVLQHFGHPTPGPDTVGTFRGRLIALIAEADAAHRRCLTRAYPGLVVAVQLARTSPTGIDTLHAIANSR